MVLYNGIVKMPEFIMKWMCLMTTSTMREEHEKKGAFDTFYIDNKNMFNIIISSRNNDSGRENYYCIRTNM